MYLWLLNTFSVREVATKEVTRISLDLPAVRINFESATLQVLLTTIFAPLCVPPFSGQTNFPLQAWRNNPSLPRVNWKCLSEHLLPDTNMMSSLSRGEQLLLDGARQRSKLFDFSGVGVVGLTVRTNVKKHVKIEWLFDFRTKIFATTWSSIVAYHYLHAQNIPWSQFSYRASHASIEDWYEDTERWPWGSSPLWPHCRS